MKNFCLLLFYLLLFSFAVSAQTTNKYQEFIKVATQDGISSKKTLAFLKQWEKDEPDNAEMLYSWYLYHFIQANELIKQTDDFSELKNSAMLPDTITRFGELQIKNIWIMKDEGDGMKHYEKGLMYMQKAISLHPDILELYINKTDGFMRKKEFKYAASMLLDVMGLDSENHKRWTDFYGNALDERCDTMLLEYFQSSFNALIEKNEFSLAEIICDTLIRLYPNSPEYVFDKGVLYLTGGQREKALQHFLNFNEQHPNNGYVLNILANMYLESGDTVNMKKYATMLLQDSNPNWVTVGQDLLSSIEPLHIDFQEIEKWYKDNTTEYKALETRFKSGDTSLTQNEIANLYFAHACTEQCTSTKLWPVNLDSLISAGNYEKCYEESRKCLEQHPASIAALTCLALSGEHVNASDLDNIYVRLKMIINVINREADDTKKREESEFKVYKILWREDEDIFVKYFMPEEERKQTSLFMNPGYFFY